MEKVVSLNQNRQDLVQMTRFELIDAHIELERAFIALLLVAIKKPPEGGSR